MPAFVELKVRQIGFAKQPGFFSYSPFVAVLAVGLISAGAMSPDGHGKDGDRSMSSEARVGLGNTALTCTVLCQSLSL